MIVKTICLHQHRKDYVVNKTRVVNVVEQKSKRNMMTTICSVINTYFLMNWQRESICCCVQLTYHVSLGGP